MLDSICLIGQMTLLNHVIMRSLTSASSDNWLFTSLSVFMSENLLMVHDK